MSAAIDLCEPIHHISHFVEAITTHKQPIIEGVSDLAGTESPPWASLARRYLLLQLSCFFAVIHPLSIWARILLAADFCLQGFQAILYDLSVTKYGERHLLMPIVRVQSILR